ncbi:MAG: hypothetical protein ACLUKN_03870 [Bacilli bacterium]
MQYKRQRRRTLNIQKNPNYSWATGMYGRIGTVDGSLIVDSGAENSERYSLRLDATTIIDGTANGR